MKKRKIFPLFTLCVVCGKHGRFTGGPRMIPIEVASKSAAYAFRDGHRDNPDVADMGIFTSMILKSAMAEDEALVDPLLRDQIATWNEAARATNRSDLFALCDFHDYVGLLGPKAVTRLTSQSN